MNTVDFLAKRGPKKWILYVQERGNLIIEAELTSGIPAWMTEGCDVRGVPTRTKVLDHTKRRRCIVECQYMFEDNPRWWKPIGLRKDKTHPNNRRTFYNTLTNIRENIQWSEFLTTCTSRGNSTPAKAAQ